MDVNDIGFDDFFAGVDNCTAKFSRSQTTRDFQQICANDCSFQERAKDAPKHVQNDLVTCRTRRSHVKTREKIEKRTAGFFKVIVLDVI
jgi:hypothetical protein